MNIFDQTYTAQAVATAVGCEAKQISDWCNLGRIVGQREPLGKGRSRKFSWFNVMEIAIAYDLMSIGIRSPQDAFAVAQNFSHSNDGSEDDTGEWIDDAARVDEGHVRHAALPFHYSHGVTFLFVIGNKSKVTLSKDGTVDLLNLGADFRQAGGFIVANVSEIFTQTSHRLGLDYRSVLDAAYGEAKAD